MPTNLPNRDQIEAAQPLEFQPAPAREARTTIRIEVAPDGLHITAEYSGRLESIPAAIERLRATGVLELVASSRPAGQAPAPASDAPPICSVHGTPMKAMEKPDKGGRRWWCTKKDGDGFCKQRA